MEETKTADSQMIFIRHSTKVIYTVTGKSTLATSYFYFEVICDCNVLLFVAVMSNILLLKSNDPNTVPTNQLIIWSDKQYIMSFYTLVYTNENIYSVNYIMLHIVAGL